MTELQSVMLAVCFGATVGMVVANFVSAVIFIIEEIAEKVRKRKAQKKA